MFKIEVNNYKSIKHLELVCSKINLFIGEPNVGKSNILEALSLFSLSWMLGMNRDLKNVGLQLLDLKEFYRINNVQDLFHKGDKSNDVSVIIDKGNKGIELKYHTFKDEGLNTFYINSLNGLQTHFDDNFNTYIEKSSFFTSSILPFKFKEDIDYHNLGNYLWDLNPPYGNNIVNVIRNNSQLLEFLKAKANGYKFNLDFKTNNIAIQLEVNEGVMYPLHYNALADTLRRVIFYKAAIKNSLADYVILEEPEAHSFPPYVSIIADEIVEAVEKLNKSFFIATHSPYLLNSILENAHTSDISVFLCGKNQQNETYVKKLSGDEISELLDYGVDIFFNINKYLDDSFEYSS